jgi:hypothetical protein
MKCPKIAKNVCVIRAKPASSVDPDMDDLRLCPNHPYFVHVLAPYIERTMLT